MNGRGRKTLELPVWRSRVAHDVTTREAHLMPSVVENYERRGEQPTDGTAPNTASGRGSSEMSIEPAKLQMLIRDLILDGAFARQMEVSPSKTLKKVQYLTERDRKRLSEIDSETLGALAAAASSYAQMVTAKDRARPGGLQSDLLGRIGGVAGLGRLGQRGRGGQLGDLDFLPGTGTGIFRGGREITSPRRGGQGGGGRGGRTSSGGLSRGTIAGLGIPRLGFGEDLAGLGQGMGSGGLPAIDLGFLDDFGRPFGGDPLAIARTWHRFHPGGAAAGDPDPYSEIFGSGWTDPSYGGSYPEYPQYPVGMWGRAYAEGWAGPGPTDDDAYARWMHKFGPNEITKAIERSQQTQPPPLTPQSPPKVDAPANPNAGAPVPPPTPNDPPKPGGGGSTPNPEDPDSPVGPRSYAKNREHAARAGNAAVENPDGTGPIGPRVRGARQGMFATPNPEGTGPIGPWVRGARYGVLATPNPEDPSGGGPVGPWAVVGAYHGPGSLYMPAPDDPGPGTPYSRSRAAFDALVVSATALLGTTRKAR